MAFGRPDAESLLGQIAGIRLVAREAERELIKLCVMISHDLFKIRTGHCRRKVKSSGW